MMRGTACALAALLCALASMGSALPQAGGPGQAAAAASGTRDRAFLRQSAFKQAALGPDAGSDSAAAAGDSSTGAAKPAKDNWSVQSVNQCIHQSAKKGVTSKVLVGCAVQLGALFAMSRSGEHRFAASLQPTQEQALEVAKSGPCQQLGSSSVSMLFGCMVKAQMSHSVAEVTGGVKKGVAATAQGLNGVLSAGTSALSNAGSVLLGGKASASGAPAEAAPRSLAEPELGDLLRARGEGDAVGASGEAAELLGRAEVAAEGIAGSLAKSLNGSPDGGSAAKAKGPARFLALGHEVAVQVSKAADSIERWAEGKPPAGA